MLAPERQQLILRVLRQSRFATVTDLAGLARSSEATIRRDLSRLEGSGLVRRVRGGAELVEQGKAAAQLPFEYRKGIMMEKKRLIARQAASLCQDEETVIIDGGSTTYQMVEFLTAGRLQIITNSFAITEYLIKHSRNTVILSGGIVYPDSQLVLDPFQDDLFRNYFASKAFMGVYGIDEMGVTNTDLLLIKTERAMIEHAKQLVILADSSKFDRRGSLMLCGFDRVHTIITDGGISEVHRLMVQSRGVNLIVV